MGSQAAAERIRACDTRRRLAVPVLGPLVPRGQHDGLGRSAAPAADLKGAAAAITGPTAVETPRNTDNRHVADPVREGAGGARARRSAGRHQPGFRARAAEPATAKPGLHSRVSGLEKGETECATGVDRALCNPADEESGIADPRPGKPNEERVFRWLIVGRTARPGRPGLAKQVAPGDWITTSRSVVTSSKPCPRPWRRAEELRVFRTAGTRKGL